MLKLGSYKDRVKAIQQMAKEHRNPLDLTRRIFLEEPSHSTKAKRDSEYSIKSEIVNIFGVEYHDIFFVGQHI